MSTGCIVRKDLLILTRDRRALAILIVMPLVFIAILGLSTGKLMSLRNEYATLKVAVVDHCNDELSRRIVASLTAREGIEVRPSESSETARGWVDDGDSVAVIEFGAGFRERADAMELADFLDPDGGRLAGGLSELDVSVYSRPSQSVAAAITEQIVYGAVMRAVLPHVARRNPLVAAYLDANKRDEAPAESEASPRPRARASVNMGNAAYQFIVPAYVVMFAFFLVNIMARSFISERQNGTLLRLRAAPIGVGQLLFGKTVPFFLISVAQGLLLFVFGRVLFGMDWGQAPWMLVPVVLCTSVAATGLGLAIAVLVRTDAQVSAYANLVVIGLAGISGCFMPRIWLPEAMRQISLAVPHSWALIAYDQVLNNPRPDVTRVGTCCVVLVAFGAGFFLFGWRRFRALPGG
jgi:ABC-type multidrug transport system permease subunit